MIMISYTNARGEEIILDDTETPYKGWMFSSEGLEAPELEYVEVTYADGSTEIIAVNVKPRDVTLYFYNSTRSQQEDEGLRVLKQKLIQSGIKKGDWGKLMIRRKDGRKLYLDCVYTGGFDDCKRTHPRMVKFALMFHAEDPYFHDDFDTKYTIKQTEGYLYFRPEPLLYMGSDIYMRSAEASTQNELYVSGEKVYPKIIINGPAENISIVNNTTGRQITLSSSVVLEAGEQITIITENRKRKITKKNKYNVTTNIMRYLTASSSLNFWLVRGSNDITFTNSATTKQSYLQFIYKEGYLSAL